MTTQNPRFIDRNRRSSVPQKRMLGDLIDKVYDGSSAALMMHALSSKKATAEELQQIRDLLDQMEGES